VNVDIVDVLVNVFSAKNLFISAAGVMVGNIFGALPGLTAAMGIAILMPLTFGMNPASALILMGAIFAGAMWGGSVSAILINTPGTPAAAATVLDGYPMAKKGQAADALRESVWSSFIGGIFGVIALHLFAPPLAMISLWFGPPEYFLLAMFGMTIIAALSEKALVKGFLAGFLGLLVGTIGMDPLLGVPRFTFGVPNLVDGIELVPALIGLFSIPETFEMIRSYRKKDTEKLPSLKNIRLGFPTWKHTMRLMPVYIRSSVIGIIIGILPGAGGSIASFMAYNETRRVSKTPELFGTGIIDGVAASEAANNAVCGGALIPMLTLGIPGDSVAAIIMGGLMVHGLLPGAELFTKHAQVTYTFIIALYMANVFMLFFGLYMAPFFTVITDTPKHILAVGVILLTTIGSYAIRENIFDVYVMMAFGILGYLMKAHGFDLTPVVLGIILGPMMEKGLYGTMAISEGENIVFFVLTRPISFILFALTAMSLAIPIYRKMKRGKTVFDQG
jgi:putative tricarboxylic transport membrane protein